VEAVSKDSADGFPAPQSIEVSNQTARVTARQSAPQVAEHPSGSDVIYQTLLQKIISLYRSVRAGSYNSVIFPANAGDRSEQLCAE